MANPSTSISVDTGRGATILTAYTEREVKAFPIFENELESLSFLNTMTLVFFSVGSAFVSFAIGIWTNAAFADKLTPEGIVAAKYGAPLLCVLSLAAYVLGIIAMFSRSSQWAKIKAHATTKTTAPEPMRELPVRRRV